MWVIMFCANDSKCGFITETADPKEYFDHNEEIIKSKLGCYGDEEYGDEITASVLPIEEEDGVKYFELEEEEFIRLKITYSDSSTYNDEDHHQFIYLNGDYVEKYVDMKESEYDENTEDDFATYRAKHYADSTYFVWERI